ncbi:MAG: DUF362 domain-containing protein [Chloroflexi bacterium]|nr:DUF362 domain-containing protein [Chloroflexota bacterium]
MPRATVALVTGDDRCRNICRALDLVADQIDLSGKRQVFVKPNLVSTSFQPAATHVDALRAVLGFLRERYDGPITIGEGTGTPAAEGFANFGYAALAAEYGVTLADLNLGDWVTARAYDRRGQPFHVHLARQVVESDFRISVGPPKTHDCVIVTLSLKNMVMGSLFHEVPFGRAGEARGLLRTVYRRIPAGIKYSRLLEALKRRVVTSVSSSDRVALHQDYASHHLNLFLLAPQVYPHLAVIDGFQGMEGDGPGAGDPVDWRTAIVSTDYVAADCLTARLMGFDLRDVAYLYYCQRAGLGTGDPEEMEIRGERPEDCRRPFVPSPIHQKQMGWRVEARGLAPLAERVGLRPEWVTGDG